MERIDRAFVVLAALALIVFLIVMATPQRKPGMPAERVGASVPTRGNPVGYAYLIANVPLYRDGDDSIPTVSVGRDSATATGATAV